MEFLDFRAEADAPVSVRLVANMHDARGAAHLLRRSLLIYGAGGVIAPFIGIKLIDIIITALGVK